MVKVLRRDRPEFQFLAVDSSRVVKKNFCAKFPDDGSVKFHYGLSFKVPYYGQICWAFIDACHCKECVKKDIKVWAPRIAEGGILAFHDVDPRSDGVYSERPPGDRRIMGTKRRKRGVVFTIAESLFLRDNFDLIDQCGGNKLKGIHKGRKGGGVALYRRKGSSTVR